MMVLISDSEDPTQSTPSSSDETATDLTIPSNGDPDAAADRIVRNHTLWSVGAGAVPVPLFDVAAVTAIQMDALKQLANTYEIDYSESTGKRFVAALAGGTFARIGASMIKVIPGVGSIIGGLSMMALSGASTYAVCQVAIHHFKEHGNFLDVDLEKAKETYRDCLEKGKDFVKKFEGKEEVAQKNYELVKKLEELRDAGVLSEEEFEAKTAEIFRNM